MRPRLLQIATVLIAPLLLVSPGRSNAETIQLQTLPAEKCVFVSDGTFTYSYDINGNVDGSSPNLVLSCSGGGAIMVGGGGRGYQGLPVVLESEQGRVKVSTKTDENGTFHFDKLPAGKFKLTLPDLSPQSITVGDKGSIGGRFKRNENGTTSITVSDLKPVVLGAQIPGAAPEKAAGPSKAADKPVGFGTGMGVGSGMMGPGGMSPGAGMNPAISGPGGAMGPGGPMMGGPGGAMSGPRR